MPSTSSLAPARASGRLPQPAGPHIGAGAGRLHVVVEQLADGTAIYVPRGTVDRDGDAVRCHFCGELFRSVTVHLRTHGLSKTEYCEMVGLERGQSLESLDTCTRRAAAFIARLRFDPAVRAGSAAGHRRARAGELGRDAAAAARGRRHPRQRVSKQRNPLPEAAAESIARSNRRRAAAHLDVVGTAAAMRLGYPDIRTWVLDRLSRGESLAGISRAAGLNKDWLSRHLPAVCPEAAEVAAGRRANRAKPPAAEGAGS